MEPRKRSVSPQRIKQENGFLNPVRGFSLLIRGSKSPARYKITEDKVSSLTLGGHNL